MVSVQIIFLENRDDGSFEYKHVPGPKVALGRIPMPEEEVFIPPLAAPHVLEGKLYRVIFVRHLAEHIPVEERPRSEWPARAEIGVIPG